MNNIYDFLNVCELKKKDRETQTDFTKPLQSVIQQKKDDYNYNIEDDLDITFSKCSIS